MIAPTFTYNASVIETHDGDTLTAVISLGFHVTYTTPIRLLGINAPELRTPTGPAARDHLNSLIGGGPIVVKTYKDPTDKYGRWLAQVFVGDLDVCAQMIADGFALAWDGKGPKPV